MDKGLGPKSSSNTEGNAKGEAETPSEAVEKISPPTAGKSKDELWETCVRLQEQVNRVAKVKRGFKMECSSLTKSWNTSKERLEATKERMRAKLLVNQEAKKQRQGQVEELQQNMEHIKIAHQEEVCELKMATTTQRQNRRSEMELQEKKGSLQVEQAEQAVSISSLIEKKKQEHLDKIKELHDTQREQVRAVEEGYESWARIKREDNRVEIQKELDVIDKTMTVKRDRVLKQQRSDLARLNKEVDDRAEVDLLLRRQLYDLKEKEMALDKAIEKASRKKKVLEESLQEQELKLSETCKVENQERKAMAERFKRSKARGKRIISETRELNVKAIQLELKVEQAENENDQLQRSHTYALLDMQKKGQMKHMLQERKIQALTETQERMELRLMVAQSVVQKDQTALKNIKELFQSKEATIASLKEEILVESKGVESLRQNLGTLSISGNNPVQRDAVRQNSVSAGPLDELLRLSGATAWP
ncbi:structural maintenance of chromosomes protein 4-like isoform X1 [Eleginops maclovinus]|uniref:structural maintenance of chromosomes protein 4-like isoform X1 n=2 Tax=Eleginops maclovinus TaxID=56733 RepID=UPI00308044E0